MLKEIRKKRILLSILALLLCFSCFCDLTIAATVKSGRPYHIKKAPPKVEKGGYGYKCWICGGGITYSWDEQEEEGASLQCPACGAYGTMEYCIYEDVHWGKVLHKLTVKRYKSKKIIKKYYRRKTDYGFDHNIVLKKPGKYVLTYYWRQYFEDLDSNTETWESSKRKKILHVLGKVEFNSNGGELSIKKTVKWKKQKSKIGKLNKPYRKGYRFIGWYTKRKGGTKISKNWRVHFRKESKTLYAHWKKK